MSDPVNVLLVGCGGREAAIARAVTRSSIAHVLHCVGRHRNPEILRLVKSYAQCDMQVSTIVALAREIAADLVVVGPEGPLAAGLVDALRTAGIRRVVGPSKRMALLESDKSWCRDLLTKYGLGRWNPRYRLFSGYEGEDAGAGGYTRVQHAQRLNRVQQQSTALGELQHYMEDELGGALVVKPIGLHGGKGVMVGGEHLRSTEEAVRHCARLVAEGTAFVVEERMVGREFSLLTLTDGRECSHFPVALDAKRAFDGGVGPNTGGMGCVVHGNELPRWLSQADYRAACELNANVVAALNLEFPDEPEWCGVLYGGFMKLDETSELKLVEYNFRFGDPEAIALLEALREDLLSLMLLATTPRVGLRDQPLTLRVRGPAVAVYVVPDAYPEPSRPFEVAYGTFVGAIADLDLGVSCVAAGLHAHVDDEVKAPGLWVAQADRVYFAGDTHEMLQNSVVRTTGSRALALVAVGRAACAALHERVMQLLPTLLGPGFRWRTDVRLVPDDVSTGAYARCGVDVEVANTAVARIAPLVRSTHTPAVRHLRGGFAGVFRCPGGTGWLVSSTDGVGSKTELVRELLPAERAMRQLGADLVNHCVNDILAVGCLRPCYFLDYFAAHSLQPRALYSFVEGVAEACRAVDCALVAGETAEMPLAYRESAMDVVGTITGYVEDGGLLEPQATVRANDVVLALPSASAHTNGYTLLNRVYADICSERDERGDDVLFQRARAKLIKLSLPHRCYLHDVRRLSERVGIKGIAHITGGGLIDNPERILPDGLACVFDHAELLRHEPPEYEWLRQVLGLAPDRSELRRVFNCGVGLIVVVRPDQTDRALDTLSNLFVCGRIVDRADGPAVRFE